MGGENRRNQGAGGLSRPFDSYSRASQGSAEAAGTGDESALFEALESEGLALDDGETFSDLRVGVGHCFLSESRVCSEACMAYSKSDEERGQNPCRLLTSMQEIAMPTMEQRDLRTSAITDHAQALRYLADAITKTSGQK